MLEQEVFQEQTFKWPRVADSRLTTHLLLKRITKPKHSRLKFNQEKLKNSSVLQSFHAMIGGKFAPLTIMNNEDAELDSMITTFNTAVTETAAQTLSGEETLGHCQYFWSLRQKDGIEKEKI